MADTLVGEDPEAPVAAAGHRYGARALLFALALALVAVPFGLLAEQVLTAGPVTRGDLDVARWLNERVSAHPGAVRVLKVVSELGRPSTLLVVVAPVVLWLLIRRRPRLAVFLAVTCVGGGIIDSIVKVLVGRTRPELDHQVATALGKSFPSGHAMSSTVCYGALVLVAATFLGPRGRRTSIVAAVVVVLAVGFSRIALGVHFLSDVIGGYALGGAWLMASVAAFEAYRADRGRPTTAPLAEGLEPEEAPGPAAGPTVSDAAWTTGAAAPGTARRA